MNGEVELSLFISFEVCGWKGRRVRELKEVERREE